MESRLAEEDDELAQVPLQRDRVCAYGEGGLLVVDELTAHGEGLWDAVMLAEGDGLRAVGLGQKGEVGLDEVVVPEGEVLDVVNVNVQGA